MRRIAYLPVAQHGDERNLLRGGEAVRGRKDNAPSPNRVRDRGARAGRPRAGPRYPDGSATASAHRLVTGTGHGRGWPSSLGVNRPCPGLRRALRAGSPTPCCATGQGDGPRLAALGGYANGRALDCAAPDCPDRWPPSASRLAPGRHWPSAATRALLFQVSAADALSLAVAAALMLRVVLAGLPPARRAATVDQAGATRGLNGGEIPSHSSFGPPLPVIHGFCQVRHFIRRGHERPASPGQSRLSVPGDAPVGRPRDCPG